MTRVLYEKPHDRELYVDVMGPVTRGMAWSFVEAIFAADCVVTLPSDGTAVDDFHVESRDDGWYVVGKPRDAELPRPALRVVS